MANLDYAELKKNGFLKQVQKDVFSLRIKLVGGQVGGEELQKVSEIAEKFGKGYVHITSRQGIEIPFIKLADTSAVISALAVAGLKPGASGPRVRTITACQGNEVCKSALIKTTNLAKEFDEKYSNREVPHKFKMGITGCRNNCLKAEENDIGVKGGMKPTWKEAACIFCGACEAVCRTKAIKVNKQEQKLTLNVDNCVNCGRCVKVCPVGTWEGKSGYNLYFGGTIGNTIAPGKQILPLLYSEEEVHKAVDATLKFFVKHGKSKERLRLTIERVGWDIFEKALKEAL